MGTPRHEAYNNARTTGKALSRKITAVPCLAGEHGTKKIASPGVPEECDLLSPMPTSGMIVSYISTISLPVSSFQLTMRYQRHMASAITARVPPYPKKVSGM